LPGFRIATKGILPDSGLQQRDTFLQRQDCNKRILGKIQACSTGKVFQMREAIMGIPPVSVLQQKGIFLRSQDCNKRIQIPYIGKPYLADPECSKGIASTMQDCNIGSPASFSSATKGCIPPESGWQQKGSTSYDRRTR